MSYNDAEVWVKHATLGYAKATPTSGKDSKMGYYIDETEETVYFETGSLDVIPILNGEAVNVDNLTKLPDLNQATLLETLNSRFDEREIYTKTGDVLISVNPFERLKQLYSTKTRDTYLGSDTNDELKPHVFGTAHRAFTGMAQNRGRNQSILVSGESGSGKTYGVKLMMEYLTDVSQRNASNIAKKDQKASKVVCDAVLQANPLLEAFGNAKTLRNDNSSRFGKLIQLQFEPGRDKSSLLGASIDTYLLEKARVLQQAEGERNYHIFYEIASNHDLVKKLNFPELIDCKITNRSTCFERKDLDDKTQFKDTLEAMDTVGITESERMQVFRIITGILHLGNITFSQKGSDGAKFSDSAQTADAAREACINLKLTEAQLEASCCTRAISAGGNTFAKFVNSDKTALSKDHTVEQANEARDALIMTLYERLFMWLVWRVNQKLGEAQGGNLGARLSQKLKKLDLFQQKLLKDAQMNKKEQRYINDYSIGCLDIFGFEVFESNSFEQLSINYANEILQQQFNGFIFKGEQALYEAEGVEWKHIQFPDNIQCIKMIEGDGKKSFGLLQLLDEECMYPNGTDKSLHVKLVNNLATDINTKKKSKVSQNKVKENGGKSSYLIVNSRAQNRGLKFSINHFAGLVEYELTGFCRKNKNELRQEAVDLLRSSKDPLVSLMLPENASTVSQDSTQAGQYFQKDYERSRRKGRGKRQMSLVRSSLQRNEFAQLKGMQKIQQKTVSRQFKDQLYQALRHINASQPHFIRCIKPNDENVKHVFDRARVLEQLNYSGVLEVVRVARAGYSTRFPHREFLGTFKCFADTKDQKDISKILNIPRKKKEQRVHCAKILDYLKASNILKDNDFQLGKTMVLFRSRAYIPLQLERNERLSSYATTIQTFYRARSLNRAYIRKRRAIRLIQPIYRGYVARKKYSVFRAELIAKRRAEEKKKAEELAWQKKKEDEERRAAEEAEREKQRVIEEAQRQEQLMRQKALEEERERLRAIEAEERFKKESAAAIKLQSIFRVVLAQKKANELYEAKEAQLEMVDDAANLVIEVFRENLRQKRLARENARLENAETMPRRRRKNKKYRTRRTRDSSTSSESSDSSSVTTRRLHFEKFADLDLAELVPDDETRFMVLGLCSVPFAILFLIKYREALIYTLLFIVAVGGGALIMKEVERRQPPTGILLQEPGRGRHDQMSVRSKMRKAIATGSLDSTSQGHPGSRLNSAFIAEDDFVYDQLKHSKRQSDDVPASAPVGNGGFRIVRNVSNLSSFLNEDQEDFVEATKSKRTKLKKIIGNTFKRKKKRNKTSDIEFPEF